MLQSGLQVGTQLYVMCKELTYYDLLIYLFDKIQLCSVEVHADEMDHYHLFLLILLKKQYGGW